jgi:hypothetical protein
MANMSEVERSLSEHLDVGREPSPAVRSVLGESFPTLHWIDAEWAARHIKPIFLLPADSFVARGAYAQPRRPHGHSRKRIEDSPEARASMSIGRLNVPR